jgi:hypothetical protein
MHWNGYTIFSVLSGVVLVVAVLVTRGVSAKDRLYGLIGGAGFIGYGIFAANQTSGTFYFPVWIFIVPPAAVGYLVVGAVRRSSRRAAGTATVPRTAVARHIADRSGQASSLTAKDGPSSPQGPHAPAERPAAWAPPPPPPPAEPTGPAVTDG